MNYRIEIQTKQGWRPAIQRTPTSLDPERASTYESAEVAFSDAKNIQAAQPKKNVRIVDASSGIVIWSPSSGIVYLSGTSAEQIANFPVQAVAAVRRKHAEVTGSLVIDSVAPRYRNMTAEQFAAEMARETPIDVAGTVVDDTTEAELSAKMDGSLLAQIIAAQEEFVEGLKQLRPKDFAPADAVDMATAAAQEILTNLRSLASSPAEAKPESPSVKRFTRHEPVYNGCLRGHLTTSYAMLVKLFGDPEPEPSGDGKVSTSWSVKDATTGQVIEIYDYKETSLYSEGLPSVADFRARDSYEWHLGSANKVDEDALTTFVFENAI